MYKALCGLVKSYFKEAKTRWSKIDKSLLVKSFLKNIGWSAGTLFLALLPDLLALCIHPLFKQAPTEEMKRLLDGKLMSLDQLLIYSLTFTSAVLVDVLLFKRKILPKIGAWTGIVFIIVLVAYSLPKNFPINESAYYRMCKYLTAFSIGITICVRTSLTFKEKSGI